jgi:pimeloyl-ACP methyl ester carboxylesterase
MRRRFLASSPVGLHVMGNALLNEADAVDDLAASGVPALVCHGDGDDAWTPEAQEQMARRLKARHVVFRGARHSPAVETPAAVVSALVDFWRSL